MFIEVLSLHNTHANGQNPDSTDGAADEGQHAVVFVTHASSLALKHLACQLQVSLGKPLGIHHFDIVHQRSNILALDEFKLLEHDEHVFVDNVVLYFEVLFYVLFEDLVGCDFVDDCERVDPLNVHITFLVSSCPVRRMP